MKYSNEITLDIEATMLLENHSITDGETIRQIGLIGCDQSGKYDAATKDILGMKIKPMFEFAALYPHVHTFPAYDPEVAKEVTANGQAHLAQVIDLDFMKELEAKRSANKLIANEADKELLKEIESMGDFYMKELKKTREDQNEEDINGLNHMS